MALIPAEIIARDFVQLEGKLVVLEARQRIGEVIDGVVGRGQRAVAAGIGRLELEIRVKLFAGLNADEQAFAICRVRIRHRRD